VAYLAKRRTKYEIYAELLDVVARKGRCRLTRASYAANLPVDRAKKSLSFLASRGFLREEDYEDSTVYRITKRGLEYLETFKHMRKLFAALDEETLAERRTLKQPYREELEAPLRANLILKQEKTRVGEYVELEVELTNESEENVVLSRLKDIIPENFSATAQSDHQIPEGFDINMSNTELAPSAAESLRLSLRPAKSGSFSIRPVVVYDIIYDDKPSVTKLLEPDPVLVEVLKASITQRVGSGYKDLDRLLLGGFPEKYAIVLTSVSCDERDLLVERFLETGISSGHTTFYATIETSGVEKLAEDFQSNFYVLVCNPQADKTIRALPNVVKLKGVDNLTDINIALTSAFRKLKEPPTGPRRACLDIVSDVLLQHHAIQTRRWLTGLLPELKAKGFTVLSVINPQMHTTEEVQAILDLFEGEISIYEKESRKGPRKFLRIKKMYNQKYQEREMSLVKERM
jgi:predicted transcriptional regulator/KaiC/GvpD/RAD55 family RecA-like ATPase